MIQRQTGAGATGAPLSLPEGGGPIQGIGETVRTDLFRGTVHHRVPIALSPGRGGFGPSLALEYGDAYGNGPFGLGWQLALPRIVRQGEKGLPRYDDSDLFVLAGTQDLVRCLQPIVDPDTGASRWVPQDPIDRGDHRVHLYRPRVEGLFARIERWVGRGTGETHWRTISRDNVTSLYGRSTSARLADPVDEQRVHAWLLQETFDGAGNHMLFEYAADDSALYSSPDPDLRLPEVFERGRVATQRYLRRIYYGNLPEPLVDAQGRPITCPGGEPVGHLRGGRRYAFEAVFDYGDWDTPTCLPHPEPLPEPQQELFGLDPRTSSTGRLAPVRADRFSDGRAGFDIRTLRRCRRVLMFHHFAELGRPMLVRSTEFSYRTDVASQASLLTAVTVTGHDRDGDGACRGASLPPVTFDYSPFEPHAQHCQPVRTLGGEMPPLALRGANVALVNLFGDGLPDLLQAGPDGLRCWRNLGNGLLDRPRMLAQMPAGMSLDQPGVGFGDMAGNGVADLLLNTGRLPGFFETTPDGAWKRFKPYETVPGFLPQDPNLRMLDLTGDGRADALLTRDQQFLWFECLGEKGFGPAQAVARTHDLAQFPDVFFDDASGRVRLADMTGDGLSDIVLVHEDRIDYWPNLGHGRFGPRVTMAGAPRLGAGFDPRRLMLADLNGTGCADLVYVDLQQVHCWFNQSGNGWSERQTLRGTPRTSDPCAVALADVFGSGTATLLWSHDPDEDDGGAGHYKALDFCGGAKPHVLVGVHNNMGSTTRISRASSIRHWLRDRERGLPWLTTMPFPVQVVDKVESIDHVNRTMKITTYLYHHGHFDGRTGRSCGFGRVDQVDTETFDDFLQTGVQGDDLPFTNDDPAFHTPPVETRNWFHTGAFLEHHGEDLTRCLRSEFYAPGVGRPPPLEGPDIGAADSAIEACQALRGALLRTELYANDGSAKAAHPYRVCESRYRVVQLQPRLREQPAVHFSHLLEKLSTHCERSPHDPRISHQLTLSADAYGNPLVTVDIGYGRRQGDASLPTDADRARQARTQITCTELRYTRAIDDVHASPDAHRAPMPCERLRHELTGFVPNSADAWRFSHAEWVAGGLLARIAAAPGLGPAEPADGITPQKRLIEHTRTHYRKNDLGGLLPLGEIESLALPGESLRRVLTTHLAAQEGGQGSWESSGRVFFSPGSGDSPAEELAHAQQHFFVAQRRVDARGHAALTRHDPYVMLAVESVDASGRRHIAELDYRVLQPRLLTEPDGNRSAVAFDTLGRVAGMAMMGRAGEGMGDSLDKFEPNLSRSQLAAFVEHPLAQSAALLGSASARFVHDLARYQREQQPVLAAFLARQPRSSQAHADAGPKILLDLRYSDGAGREIERKVPADPGPLVEGGPVVDPRWFCSGRTVLDHEGRPVRRFEPCFDHTHEFGWGQRADVASSSMFHDPLSRVVAVLHSNRRWEKAVFGAWSQSRWDVDDTCLVRDPSEDQDVGGFFQRLSIGDYLPTWLEQRHGGGLGDAEEAAAAMSALQAQTPTVVHADALGRPFVTIVHHRFEREGATVDERRASRVLLEHEGQQQEEVVETLVVEADAAGRARSDAVVPRPSPSKQEASAGSLDDDSTRPLPDREGRAALAWPT